LQFAPGERKRDGEGREGREESKGEKGEEFRAKVRAAENGKDT
jgi:hypothetical protein